MYRDLQALRLQLALTDTLKDLTKNNINFQNWQERNQELLSNIFGSGSPIAGNFNKICYHVKIGKADCQVISCAKEKYLLGLEEAREILGKAILTFNEEDELITNVAKFNYREAIDLASLDDQEKQKIISEVKKSLEGLNRADLSKSDDEFYKSRLVCLLNKVSAHILRY